MHVQSCDYIDYLTVYVLFILQRFIAQGQQNKYVLSMDTTFVAVHMHKNCDVNIVGQINASGERESTHVTHMRYIQVPQT